MNAHALLAISIPALAGALVMLALRWRRPRRRAGRAVSARSVPDPDRAGGADQRLVDFYAYQMGASSAKPGARAFRERP